LLIDGQDGMVIPSDVFEDDGPRGFPLRSTPAAGLAERADALRTIEDLQKKTEVEYSLQRVVEIQQLEADLAEARAALEKEKVAADLTATLLERVSKLFANGAAKKEEVDQAKAAVDEARARVKDREKKVQVLEERLKTQKGAPEKDGPAPVRPVEKK
jgi:multidrug resistance efflux pump